MSAPVQYRTPVYGEAVENGAKHWTPDTELTGADILRLRETDALDAADVYDARLQRLERLLKTSFAELGLILCEVEDRQLWSRITDPATGTYFTSFERWVVERAPVSRSHAFAAKGAIRALRDVKTSDLQDMPQFAIRALMEMSPAVRREPGLIEAAKTMTEDQLDAHIERQYPEQHRERRYSRHLRFPVGARQPITQGMEAVMWCYDVNTWEEAIERVLDYFLDGWCEREDAQGKKNREAYEGRLG